MTKKINLDIAEVEPREQRLGTIIGWDGTTEELAKASGYEARGKVHATALGISPDFRPAPPERVAEVRAKLGLERPFLLDVGTVEPRKNLPFLVDFWERIAPEGYDLVVDRKSANVAAGVPTPVFLYASDAIDVTDEVIAAIGGSREQAEKDQEALLGRLGAMFGREEGDAAAGAAPADGKPAATATEAK